MSHSCITPTAGWGRGGGGWGQINYRKYSENGEKWKVAIDSKGCSCIKTSQIQCLSLPSRSSFTSLEDFSLSSRRFLSIILLLSTAALSSALIVQPIFSTLKRLRSCRLSGFSTSWVDGKHRSTALGAVWAEVSQPRRSGVRGGERRWHRRLVCPSQPTEWCRGPTASLLYCHTREVKHAKAPLRCFQIIYHPPTRRPKAGQKKRIYVYVFIQKHNTLFTNLCKMSGV